MWGLLSVYRKVSLVLSGSIKAVGFALKVLQLFSSMIEVLAHQNPDGTPASEPYKTTK